MDNVTKKDLDCPFCSLTETARESINQQTHVHERIGAFVLMKVSNSLPERHKAHPLLPSKA